MMCHWRTIILHSKTTFLWSTKATIMVALLKILCILLLEMAGAHSTSLSLASLLSGLGWTSADIVGQDPAINHRLFKDQRYLPLRIKSLANPELCSTLSNIGLILISTDIDNAKLHLECASRRRPQRSLVLLQSNITIR